jgi:hypothetical protein
MLNFIVPVETFGPNCNHPTMYIATQAGETRENAVDAVVASIRQQFADLNLDGWSVVPGRARLTR